MKRSSRKADTVHSIFEIPGARDVAIEFRSFSKTAGLYRRLRCASTVVPRGLKATDAQGNAVDVHPLWSRRQTTKFNGVSYPDPKRRGGGLLARRPSGGPGADCTITWKTRASSAKACRRWA